MLTSGALKDTNRGSGSPLDFVMDCATVIEGEDKYNPDTSTDVMTESNFTLFML